MLRITFSGGTGEAARRGGMDRAPKSDRFPPALTTAVSSDQACLRHRRVSAYRCYLPVLTGFTGAPCAGPDPQHHLPRADQPETTSPRDSTPLERIAGYREPLSPHLARPVSLLRVRDTRISLRPPRLTSRLHSAISYDGLQIILYRRSPFNLIAFSFDMDFQYNFNSYFNTAQLDIVCSLYL